MVPVHNPVNKPTTQCTYHYTFSAHCNPLQPTAKHLVHIQYTLQHTATLCSLQPNIQCTYYSSHYIFSAHTTAAITSSVHILQQPLHLQCTYYSSHYIFSAHTTAAITSSVHILQQPLHLQCTYYSSHYIFSAHCNHGQPCTAICSQSSVHTAANCSHLQPSTLQLYHSVYTAATLSDANTIQCI